MGKPRDPDYHKKYYQANKAKMDEQNRIYKLAQKSPNAHTPSLVFLGVASAVNILTAPSPDKVARLINEVLSGQRVYRRSTR